jgi:hypothetical protein
MPMRTSVAVASLVLCLSAGLPRPAEAAPRVFAWPSVEQQLARDRVPAGSALERLVLANQDFSVLHPREATDTVRVPAWLRVHWRRMHPDWRYNPADPAGGYPLVLKEIHEWMVTHPDLRSGPAEPDVAPRAAGAEVTALPDRRISPPLTSAPRSESDIRIDYWNPNRVIAASNNIGGSGRQAMYWSTDGGATWGQSSLAFTTNDGFHSDPTVDWTSDGTAWSTTIGITDDGEDLRLRLYRSTDGGRNWTFDSTISGSHTSADKQQAWVDHSAASPFADNLYVIWHNDRPVYMNRKRLGQPWGSPIKVSGRETTGTGIGADVKTNSAGVVFGFWPDTGSRKIYLVRSTDGGASYSRPQAIASTFDSFDIGIPAQASRRALVYVSAGTWKAGGQDLAFAVWTDLSGASGCRSASDEPGNRASSGCKTRIWLARSTDGGLTWEPKRMLNNQPGKNDQFNPALVVDEQTGVVSVVYYDTAGDTARRRTHLYYQSSADGGATWSGAFRVTSAPSDETRNDPDGNQYGDYNGLSAWAGAFLPAWTDRRGSGSEEIWTAPLEDGAGPCDAPAAPASLVAAAVGNGRIDLAWGAVSGATRYHLYRSTSAAGGFALVGTTNAPATSRSDSGLAAGTTYFYRVRAWDGCESSDSPTASATAEGPNGECTATTLFSEGFEAASGLAGWSRDTFVAGGGVSDWRGVQACATHTGGKAFRFGGDGCSSDHGNGRFAYVRPGGAEGIAVPAGASAVRLSFWHRYFFETGFDGGSLLLSLDGGNYRPIAAAALSGVRYEDTVEGSCEPDGARGLPIFTGSRSAFAETVVDLDAACDAANGGSGGCGGRSVRIAFTAITDCGTARDGWFLDDVAVTACVP